MAQITMATLGLRAFNANGYPVNGARCYVYENETTTPVTTYQDEELTVPHPWPVVANGNGGFPEIYVPDGFYKLNITDKKDASLPGFPKDNLNFPFAPISGAVDLALEAAQEANNAALMALVGTGTGFDSVQQMLDSTIAYGLNSITHNGETVSLAVEAGDVWSTAGGFSYTVALSNAVDHHLETAGGVRLYVLPFGNTVHREQFAISESSTGGMDVMDAMRMAVDICPSGGVVDFSGMAGTFEFDARVDIEKPLTLKGPGLDAVLALADDSDTFATSGGAAMGQVVAIRSSNVRVDGLFMDMNKANNYVTVGGIDYFFYLTAGSSFRALQPISILNYGIEKFSDITVHNCRVVNCGRGGITADGGVSYDSGGDETAGGVLPDLSQPENYLRNVEISKCFIHGTANTTAGFTGGVINSVVKDCTFFNCGWSGARVYHSCRSIRLERNTSIIDWSSMDPTKLADNTPTFPAGTNKTGCVVEIGHEWRGANTIADIVATGNRALYLGTPVSAGVASAIIIRPGTVGVTVEDFEVSDGWRIGVDIQSLGGCLVRNGRIGAVVGARSIAMDVGDYVPDSYGAATWDDRGDIEINDVRISGGAGKGIAWSWGASVTPPVSIVVSDCKIRETDEEGIYSTRGDLVVIEDNLLRDCNGTASAGSPMVRHTDEGQAVVLMRGNIFHVTGDTAYEPRSVTVGDIAGSTVRLDRNEYVGFVSYPDPFLPVSASRDDSKGLGRAGIIPSNRVSTSLVTAGEGKLGDWAADNTWLFLYGSDDTWRRVGISTF